MSIKYFMTAFATFTSISVAQGGAFWASQNLIQRASSVAPLIDLFSREQLSKALSDVVQMELSCINSNPCMTAAQLVPVSHFGKNRGPKKGPGKKGRPRLSRGPMSF
ncbi:hypothetical protein [Bartonella massiliensis]|uniref:hypothetical protein n=1 Tax=Bartonella massiliensis TaxID=929795 RepID=UPI00163CCF3F|nr:hypothetical protein [Bartonella massiliensis]